MRAVNLLPLELRPAAPWKTIGRRASARDVLASGGIAAGVLALALGGLALYQRGVVEDRRADLREVQARLVAADAEAAVIRETQAANAVRLAAVRDVVGRRVPWEDVLLDLSRVLPPKVQLQSLQVSPGTTAAAGATFTVAGFADSQVRVAQVLDRLESLPWLSGVTLQSSAGGGSGQRTPVAFTISGTFNFPGGGR